MRFNSSKVCPLMTKKMTQLPEAGSGKKLPNRQKFRDMFFWALISVALLFIALCGMYMLCGKTSSKRNIALSELVRLTGRRHDVSFSTSGSIVQSVSVSRRFNFSHFVRNLLKEQNACGDKVGMQWQQDFTVHCLLLRKSPAAEPVDGMFYPNGEYSAALQICTTLKSINPIRAGPGC